MLYLGLDIGSSSVKLAVLSEQCVLVHVARMVHGEDAYTTALALVNQAVQKLKVNPASIQDIVWCVTGDGASRMTQALPTALVLEHVPALTLGAQRIASQACSIIEIGARSALYITDIAPHTPPRFATNDSCAAGTGSFFEAQMSRLGTQIEDYSRMVQDATSIPRLSGRCAVFAKTDIIHRQQEGVPLQDILLGLCFALVKSYKALIVRNLPIKKPVLLTGGVLQNAGVVKAVRSIFKLSDGELISAEHNLYLQAVGAAMHVRNIVLSQMQAKVCNNTDVHAGGTSNVLHDIPLPALIELTDVLSTNLDSEPLQRNAPLPHITYNPGQGYQLRPQPWPTNEQGKTPCTLGIDVGSISTNLVLVDQEGCLLDAQYLRTRGNPKQAVADGLASLQDRLASTIQITAVATTGSGREMIGSYVGADIVRDEITAQARAAAQANPQADTVFEIGGQDSKYICLTHGAVSDFQMNKVCAAGTGSFVEEQAARLAIPLSDYGNLALSSAEPVDLGERCTVFVETAITTALAKGASKRDIAAGLCQSIVRNYLHRVVGNKPVGENIVLQGGVNYNAGIVAAFKQFYGDRVVVSPWFAVSGAVGVALLAQEAHLTQTKFRGFDVSGTCAEAVTNGGNPSASSGCAHDSLHESTVQIQRNKDFFHSTQSLLEAQYNPTPDSTKLTVGIPRSLMMYKLFPLANAFFSYLGYNVLISPESNEDIVQLAQQAAQGEICYPVKLMHGHMQWLLDQGVDYVFMPSIHTIRHKHSTIKHNYGCPYMHEAARFIAQELRFSEHNVRLLSPLLDLDFGQQAMATAMLDVGKQLDADPHQTARALLAGSHAVDQFTKQTEAAGKAFLDSIAPHERVIVMVTRNYGIEDAILNMGIPDVLMERGQKVITISHLQAHDVDISQKYPNVYWPFGQHILSAVKLIAQDPRLFAVYLTNHGCGPDTMLSHLVAEEMGDKPYLQIEVDEHFSKVGVITRIEAFLNALDQQAIKPSCAISSQLTHAAPSLPTKQVDQNTRSLVRSLPVVLPSYGPYGHLLASWLDSRGFTTQVFTPTKQNLADGKAYSLTKEYLSFSSLLGMSLEANHVMKQDFQLLLPSGEGSDADGQFDRVVRSVLNRLAKNTITYVAPQLEQLPSKISEVDGLFNCLLAGDILLALPAKKQSEVLQQLLGAHCSFESIVAAAQQASTAPVFQRKIGVVGEWPLVVSDFLTTNSLTKLTSHNCQVVRMPLAEYFWCMWNDSNQAQALLDRLAQRMQHVHEMLGSCSPYAGNPAQLIQSANELIGKVRASNARYRIAKMHDFAQHVDGVVAVSSMYENTDIMLQLIEATHECKVPTMHMSFDGVLDTSFDEKLKSFLYYL